MHPLIEKIDALASENNLQVYRISVATDSGTETLERIPCNPCQDCYSVAKLFCVTAIGMLYDEGRLSLSDSVSDIFSEELAFYGIPKQKWEGVTLDCVLRHRVGFSEGFLDIDTEDITQYPTDDFLFTVLSRPLSFAPGEREVYSDAAYYLLSRAVSKISGEKLDSFLMSRLLTKIGCREVAWARCPHNYPIGATGLYIRTEDVARLGRIYLDGGVYRGERILSEQWVDTVLSRGYELRKMGKGYAKGGMRGQLVYISFDGNLSLAWHSFESDGKMRALTSLL
ncbi:MAG: serine hydrolase [Clostridia bacterium]|nr:serine hydrolase [Clostridia bacterium]